MLIVLALTGYDTVSGTARVDSETGLNTLTPSPGGPHRYGLLKWESARYQQTVNSFIR